MKASEFVCVGLMFLFSAVTPLGSLAVETPLTEKEKIEALILHLENLNGATFIRNGSDYAPKTAAKFLRGKWEKDKQIKTALEFIEKVATASSTSGKQYMIRFQDARELKCSEYLKSELIRLERGKPR